MESAEAASIDSAEINRRLDRLWSASHEGEADYRTRSAIGQQIANYKLRAVLGGGAFGVVYLADDVVQNRTVAIKLPRAEALADSDRQQQFLNEASLVAKLDHESIVQVLDSGVDGLVPFIVTEWCEGPDLAAWLEGRIELPPWEHSVQLIETVAAGIHHAHQRGVQHRDLKPANLLLARLPDAESRDTGLQGFTPKITDFGLAKLAAPVLNRNRSSLVVGTPLYMAPEQIDVSQRRPSPIAAADVYSLGVILFELLTGRVPVEGDDYFSLLLNVRSGSRLKLQRLRKKLPRGLRIICNTCLAKNPRARYATADDLAADCRSVLLGVRPRGRRLGIGHRYAYWHRCQNWLKAAGAFSLFYCLLLTTWFGMTSIGLAYFNVVPKESYAAMIPAAATVFVGSLLIPGILAALCLRGNRWAAWAAILILFPKIVSAMYGMGGKPLSFRDYYANYSPYLCFTVHLFILVACGGQLLLYLFAIMASRETRNTLRPQSGSSALVVCSAKSHN